MKISITADVHLNDKYPERKKALENILKKSEQENISNVIIAGDLFDKNIDNYSQADELFGKYSRINILIIPGNHDCYMSQNGFESSNVRVFNKTDIIGLGGERFIMLPYKEGNNAGAFLAENISTNSDGAILISHCDFMSSASGISRNKYEEGMYMPLSGYDIQKYKFKKVFLGHIHKKSVINEKVYYPGSPEGIDINETGVRYFIIYDTDSNFVMFEKMVSKNIFQNEKLTVIPLTDAKHGIDGSIEKMINSWEVEDDDLKKTTLRLKLNGLTNNKSVVLERLNESLKKKGITLYEDIDSSELNFREVSGDLELVISKVTDFIESNMQNSKMPNIPEKDEVIAEALKIISGGIK